VVWNIVFGKRTVLPASGKAVVKMQEYCPIYVISGPRSELGQTPYQSQLTRTGNLSAPPPHRTQIMERLDIHDVASLVRYLAEWE